MTKILIASKNKHKISKLTEILSSKFDKIETLAEVGITSEVEENGTTFRENATIKARDLSKKYDGFVIATDAGADIPALSDIWNPLFTKRFVGENVGDEERVNNFLKLMEDKTDRRIQFTESFVICKNGEVVFALDTKSPEGRIVEKWDGRIKYGAYLLALWYLPNRNKMFFDLTPEEMQEEENTWRDLKVQIDQIF